MSEEILTVEQFVNNQKTIIKLFQEKIIEDLSAKKLDIDEIVKLTESFKNALDYSDLKYFWGI